VPHNQFLKEIQNFFDVYIGQLVCLQFWWVLFEEGLKRAFKFTEDDRGEEGLGVDVVDEVLGVVRVFVEFLVGPLAKQVADEVSNGL
jgi:hypothetical protein